MERLALLGSVNVPDEPEVRSFEWSPRQLLSRWGWLVPVATVVVLVAVWERQPSRPASVAPASPAASAVEKQMPAAKPDEDGANEPSLATSEEAQTEARFAPPARQVAEAPKAKDARAKAELQAGARDGAPRREPPAAGGAATDRLALGDKKEVDALAPLQANKIAGKPEPAPVVAPQAAAKSPIQTEAAASVAGRADEAKPGNQPKALATPAVPETVAQGALLKSATEAPLVVASGPGVSIRRSGTGLERSTDNGATWAVDLADAPAGLHVGSCPTPAVCWLGGSHGIVLLRQSSGNWTRHVVADGRAAVTAIQAADGLKANVVLSDGRRFHTADGGVTWVETGK
jgi:hypothetical protein